MITRSLLLAAGVLLLGACRSGNRCVFDQAIERDPSAENYRQRAGFRWSQAESFLSKDPARSLEFRRKAFEDLDQAIAFASSEQSEYLAIRGTWRAKQFSRSKDAADRDASLASFAAALALRPEHPVHFLHRGEAFVEFFDAPQEAKKDLLEALRLCRQGPKPHWSEPSIHKALVLTYTSLARAAEGRPEAAGYLELAARSQDVVDQDKRRRGKEFADYLAAGRRSKEAAREEGYRSAAAREASRSEETAQRQEAERRFREAHKECDKCSGRGWNFKLGYTEHKVDTVKTDRGLVIESKTTSVPSGAVGCLPCGGKGYVPKN